MYLSAMGAPGSRRPCGAMPAKGGFLKFASYKTGNIREHHVTASSYPRSGVSAGLGRSGLPSRACRSVWQDLGNLGEGTPALHPEAYRGPAAVRDHRRLAAATVRCLLGYVALPVSLRPSCSATRLYRELRSPGADLDGRGLASGGSSRIASANRGNASSSVRFLCVRRATMSATHAVLTPARSAKAFIG